MIIVRGTTTRSLKARRGWRHRSITQCQKRTARSFTIRAKTTSGTSGNPPDLLHLHDLKHSTDGISISSTSLGLGITI